MPGTVLEVLYELLHVYFTAIYLANLPFLTFHWFKYCFKEHLELVIGVPSVAEDRSWNTQVVGVGGAWEGVTPANQVGSASTHARAGPAAVLLCLGLPAAADSPPSSTCPL